MKNLQILFLILLICACSSTKKASQRNIASEASIGVVNIIDSQGTIINTIFTIKQADHSFVDYDLSAATQLLQIKSDELSISEAAKKKYFYPSLKHPEEFHFYSCGHRVGCKAPYANYSAKWPPTLKSSLSNKNDDDYFSWRIDKFYTRYEITKKEKRVLKKVIKALFRKPQKIKVKEKHLKLLVNFFEYLTHPSLRR